MSHKWWGGQGYLKRSRRESIEKVESWNLQHGRKEHLKILIELYNWKLKTVIINMKLRANNESA